MIDFTSCPWEQFTPGLMNSCEEMKLCSWVRQPFNTYSNVGFILVSAWFFNLARKGGHVSYYLSTATIALLMGLASMFTHAAKIRLGGTIDFFVLACLLNFFIAANLKEWWRSLSVRGKWSYFLAVHLPILGLIIYELKLGKFIVGALVVVYLVTLYKNQRHLVNTRPMNLTKLFFAVAFTCYILDITKLVCFPDNHWFQLHGFWHVFTAAALSQLIVAYTPSAKRDFPLSAD